MKKSMEKAIVRNQFSALRLAFAVAALSLAETALVSFSILPQVLSYSPGNTAFSLVRVAVYAYAGWLLAGKGAIPAAKAGALLGFVSSSSLIAFSLVSKAITGNAVLGLFVPAIPIAAAIYAMMMISNALLGALVSAIANAAAGRFSR